MTMMGAIAEVVGFASVAEVCGMCVAQVQVLKLRVLVTIGRP